MKKIINKANNIRKIVMVKHTIYSLIMALVIMVVVNETLPRLYTTFWIIIALVGAVIGGSATNAVVDMENDKENPLKANRGMSSGIVNKTEGIILAIIGYLIMILSSIMLNEICLILSPLAVMMLVIQAYSKRFTWGCHFCLGLVSSAAPVGVWIACTGNISIIAVVMGIGNMLWVTASDIVYSIKSYEFNMKNGNPTIPTKFGVENSIIISRAIYCIATIVLIVVGLISTKLGLLYYVMLIILICTITKTNRGIVAEYRESVSTDI